MTEQQADKMLYLLSCIIDLLARPQGIKAQWDEATQKVVEAQRVRALDEHGNPKRTRVRVLAGMAGNDYVEFP